MKKYSQHYEQAYIPIFEYMFDPTKINFEDDILMIIKNFIKKTGTVSDTIFNVLPQLEKVFHEEQAMLRWCAHGYTQSYMIYGRERFLTEPGAIQMLLRIAD